ncbi:AraC family transcriptional regulator [Leifsonia sp. 2MCAF36]|uniref:AraC family transcriptional regulator n=1 Tax=Leifsonia sp. 2MCAF36 TaxID=3232988 RepID=UPI003F9CC040
MTSVARAHWDFVFWEAPDGIHAGVHGPESRATRAPVADDSEFTGIRLALGTFLAGLPVPAFVDRFVSLPVDGDAFRFGGERLRLPRFDQAEEFIEVLIRTELLLSATFQEGSVPSDRTRQRRYLAATGLPQRTVRQIERANHAAVRLRAGEPPATVAHDVGYFDQPHLARSLRRFIGPSATELATGAHPDGPLSLLYKTRTAPDR